MKETWIRKNVFSEEFLRIEGDYKGRHGFFEFIKEADGTINHRFFRVK
jgi:filamentous hemagglutinin